MKTEQIESKYLNRQKYSECQLVAIINAAIFFGHPPVEEAEYERLVDLVGARYGSAIRHEYALRHFGLRVTPASAHFNVIDRAIHYRHPVAINVSVPEQGQHTILAIETRINGYNRNQLKVLNLKGEDWVDWNWLMERMTRSNDLGTIGGIAEKLRIPPMVYIFSNEKDV